MNSFAGSSQFPKDDLPDGSGLFDRKRESHVGFVCSGQRGPLLRGGRGRDLARLSTPGEVTGIALSGHSLGGGSYDQVQTRVGSIMHHLEFGAILNVGAHIDKRVPVPPGGARHVKSAVKPVETAILLAN